MLDANMLLKEPDLRLWQLWGRQGPQYISWLLHFLKLFETMRQHHQVCHLGINTKKFKPWWTAETDSYLTHYQDAKTRLCTSSSWNWQAIRISKNKSLAVYLSINLDAYRNDLNSREPFSIWMHFLLKSLTVKIKSWGISYL